MTPAERLAALHKWLYGWCQIAGETSVIDLMDELRALRQAGIAYPDLPANGIECQDLLCKLVYDAVDIALSRKRATRRDYETAWKYFCGVCWSKIRDREGGS